MKLTASGIAVTLTAILAVQPMQTAQSAANSFVVPISIREADHDAALSYQCVERFTETDVEVLAEIDRDKLFPGDPTVQGFKIGERGYIGRTRDKWVFRASPSADLQPCTPTALIDLKLRA